MPTTLVLFPTTSPLGTAIDLESSAATATSDAASISYFVTESISLATSTSYYVVTESPSTLTPHTVTESLVVSMSQDVVEVPPLVVTSSHYDAVETFSRPNSMAADINNIVVTVTAAACILIVTIAILAVLVIVLAVIVLR